MTATFVQISEADSPGFVTSVSVLVAGASTAGNENLVFINSINIVGPRGGGNPTVTDTVGNVYTLTGTEGEQNDGGLWAQLWTYECQNIAASGAGTNTVKADFGATIAINSYQIRVLEYSGQTLGPHAIAFGHGLNSPASTSPIVTFLNNEVLVARSYQRGYANNNGNNGVVAPWIRRGAVADYATSSNEEWSASPAGSYSAGNIPFYFNGNIWVMAMVNLNTAQPGKDNAPYFHQL